MFSSKIRLGFILAAIFAVTVQCAVAAGWVPFASFKTPTVNWVAEGDSITVGLGGQPSYPFVALSSMPGASVTITNPNIAANSPVTGLSTVFLTDIATSGISALTIDTNYSTRAGTSFDASKGLNVLSLMIGTNSSGGSDTTALQKYGLIRDYLRKSETTGYQRKIIGTITARDDDEGTFWNSTLVPLNTFIRTYYNSDLRCDALMDFGADARFSPNTAADNLTYYISDKLHPNITGEAAMGTLSEPPILSAMLSPGGKTTVATLSPFDIYGVNITLSNGNRTVTAPSGAGGFIAGGLPAKKSGKWYWQISIDNDGSTFDQVGMINETYVGGNGNLGTNVNSIAYLGSSGAILINNVTLATAATFTTGDVIEIAEDAGNKLIWFRRNRSGVAQSWNGNGSANPATGIGGISLLTLGTGYLHPAISIFQSGDQMTTNFATSQFQNSAMPTSGYSAFGP